MNILKKFIACLLIFIIFSSVYVFAEDKEQPTHHEDGKVVVAEVPTENFDAFYRFVETGEPNIYDIVNFEYMYEMAYMEDGREAIRETSFLSQSKVQRPIFLIKGERGGTWYFGHHLVAGLRAFETFDYFVHTANIQDWLVKNGIECSINDYLILSISRYFPPVLWVDTDKGDYYIILEQVEKDKVYNELTGDNCFTCDIYDTQKMLETKAEIIEKSKTPPIEIVIDLGQVMFDIPPIIKNDRILAPVRALCERMGASVNWEESTQTVTVTRGETVIVFTIGDIVAEVNGEKYNLDVAPEIINDRTLVPLRFVAEKLGYLVVWIWEERVELYSHYNKDTINKFQ